MGRSFSGTCEVSDGELCITRSSEKPDCDEIWQSKKDLTRVELRKSWLTEGKSALVLPN